MKVVVAIDSFKGSLTSMEAGYAAKEGILRAGDAEVVVKPLACSLAMGAVVWALWRFVFGGVPASGGFLPRLLPVVVCIAAGMAVFVAAALLTGAVSPELLPARLRPKQRG